MPRPEPVQACLPRLRVMESKAPCSSGKLRRRPCTTSRPLWRRPRWPWRWRRLRRAEAAPLNHHADRRPVAHRPLVVRERVFDTLRFHHYRGIAAPGLSARALCGEELRSVWPRRVRGSGSLYRRLHRRIPRLANSLGHGVRGMPLPQHARLSRKRPALLPRRGLFVVTGQIMTGMLHRMRFESVGREALQHLLRALCTALRDCAAASSMS